MQSTEPETWKPVVGCEGFYEVSNEGRVRSSRGRISGGWMSGKYRMVSLGKAGPRQVHVLVLEAFVGKRPEGMDGCHNDGDPGNNRVENLRWGTRSSNILDTVRHRTHYSASKTECPYGHRLESPNLVRHQQRRGRRSCLACHRAVSHAKYHGRDFALVADEKYLEIMGMTL